MTEIATLTVAATGGAIPLIIAVVAFAVVVGLALRGRARSITTRPYANPYTDAPGARSDESSSR